jgi:hypothetical protein
MFLKYSWFGSISNTFTSTDYNLNKYEDVVIAGIIPSALVVISVVVQTILRIDREMSK